MTVCGEDCCGVVLVVNKLFGCSVVRVCSGAVLAMSWLCGCSCDESLL